MLCFIMYKCLNVCGGLGSIIEPDRGDTVIGVHWGLNEVHWGSLGVIGGHWGSLGVIGGHVTI